MNQKGCTQGFGQQENSLCGWYMESETPYRKAASQVVQWRWKMLNQFNIFLRKRPRSTAVP